MENLMIITPVEWVLFALVMGAMVHAAVVWASLRNAVVKAETRPAFRGLSKSLTAASKRSSAKK